MNLIDSIKHQLILVNPCLASWRIKLSYINNHNTSLSAHNEVEYRGRMIRFYFYYVIDKMTYDINLEKIIFRQPDVGSHTARDRLAHEMMKKIKLAESIPYEISVQNDLEKAAQIILRSIKSIGKDQDEH